jgi:cell wall-associated NlpC family hydrolase
MMPVTRLRCQATQGEKTLSNSAGSADRILEMKLSGRLLIVVLAASVTGCAARGGRHDPPVPRPFPGAALPPRAGDSEPPPGPEALPAPTAASPLPPHVTGVVAVALNYRGVPYRDGGSDPSGFDCSGFMQYVFNQLGAVLPREVRDQFRVGTEVRRADIEPGDLVFFETISRGASHVGLAIGGDEFVHAPSSRGVVRVERLTSSYWTRRYVGARRVR